MNVDIDSKNESIIDLNVGFIVNGVNISGPSGGSTGGSSESISGLNQESWDNVSAAALDARDWGNHENAGYAKLSSSPTFTGTVTAENFFKTSDERLKNFGEDVDVDFEKLKTIPKKSFTWKDGHGYACIGVSAQKVKDIYPELVKESEDGMLSVDYEGLAVVALRAIDILNERVAELERK